MILKLKNQNMAAFKAVAFQSLACVWFCVSTAAAVQNCSLVNCKVLPVGENSPDGDKTCFSISTVTSVTNSVIKTLFPISTIVN